MDFAGFSILVLMPGSRLFYDWVKRNNVDVSKIDWTKFDSYNSKMTICDVSVKRLHKLCKKANLEFYLRFKILLGFVKYLRQIKWILRRWTHYK